jgi:hypothetical protein
MAPARVRSAAVARVLIVGGGCRGRRLAAGLAGDGHAVRITTRGETGRAAIEASGAECWIGTPDRLATLRGALDSVTIACWLLGALDGEGQENAALHGTRLELFLTQAIDTTVRGIVYEARGTSTSPVQLRAGERIVGAITAASMIPAACLTCDPAEEQAWQQHARGSIDALLARA